MKKLITKLYNSGPVLIVLAASLWAMDGIIRRSLYSLSPVNIVFFEHFIGSLILLPVFVKLLPKFRKLFSDPQKLKQIAAPLFLVAMFGGLLGTLWFTTALAKINFIPFSVVFLLQKLQPIFAVATATIFLKEKITKKYLIWASLAIIAAYFVTFPGGIVNLSTGSGTIMAALLAIGAAFAWGASTTFSKMLLKHVDSNMGTVLRFFTTTIFALVAVFIMGQQASLPTIELSQILRLVVIALSTGVVAMWVYYRGLKRVQAKVSTILELSFPVLAIFIDMFLYKTFLSPMQYLAAGVLFFAIYRMGRLG